MPQAQLKKTYAIVNVTCSHCQQEQFVHIQAGTGFWSMAHQSVKCFTCRQCFDVMLPAVIIAGPFLP
jgi:RNase P subunit RPR2